MFILQPCLPALGSLPPSISTKYPSFLYVKPPHIFRLSSSIYSLVARRRTKILQAQLETKGFDEEMEDGSDESWDGGGFRGREDEEKDYDRDPEFAEILGSCLDDPDKAKSKVEERVRKKRNKILHTKTGSSNPMKVHFNKETDLYRKGGRGVVISQSQRTHETYDGMIALVFDFSNSYIWLELYNAPLEKDVTLISDTIRSWHIVGRLGGCNSMNMQLSQSPLEQRPSYDAVQGANVTPTTFYNIGDLEVQDNLARIWVDIGMGEPLLLDILINALTQISSDYVGIKQVMFGGPEFENWKENLKTEEVGYTLHKI